MGIIQSEKKVKAIGFFDSGTGGLSVLCEARKLLPHEDFIYYADNINAPYGNLEDKKITKLTLEGVKYLLGFDVKMLVIACNTATAASANYLRGNFDLPIIGLEPAVLPASRQTKTKKILVIATQATINCKKYPLQFNGAEVRYCASKHLASVIENNFNDDNMIFCCIKKLLCPYDNWGYDCLVLGCTHYVLKRRIFEQVLCGRAQIFDGNYGTAQNIKRILAKKDILNTSGGKTVILLSNSSKNKDNLYKSILNGCI